VTTLGANGFDTQKLVPTILAGIRNIKDWGDFHFVLTPGVWAITGIS
jgi:hypothetical protein